MTPGMACGMNSTTLVLMSPHVGEGHGDFHADEPGADDHGVLHAAGSAGLAERVGVLKVFAPPTFLRSRPSTGGTLGVLPWR